MNPNLEMKVNKTQAGLYTVTFGYKEAPSDAQEAAFAVHGLHIVFPAELGFLRAKEGKGTFNFYSRTGTDIFCDDRHDHIVIVPNGAISGLVGIANLVDAHKQFKEYVIPKSQRDLVYAVVDEMLRNGTAITANHGKTNVSTSKFGQTELTSKLFSDGRLGINAQDYGDWLKGQGIGIQSILLDSRSYVKSQEGPYVDRLRAFGPGSGFNVNGYGRILGGNFSAFGVRFEKTAEGGAKK